MDSHGSFEYWIKDALDKKRWAWMIESKLDIPTGIYQNRLKMKSLTLALEEHHAHLLEQDLVPLLELEEIDNNPHHHTNLHHVNSLTKISGAITLIAEKMALEM